MSISLTGNALTLESLRKGGLRTLTETHPELGTVSVELSAGGSSVMVMFLLGEAVRKTLVRRVRACDSLKPLLAEVRDIARSL